MGRRRETLRRGFHAQLILALLSAFTQLGSTGHWTAVPRDGPRPVATPAACSNSLYMHLGIDVRACCLVHSHPPLRRFCGERDHAHGLKDNPLACPLPASPSLLSCAPVVHVKW